MELPGDTILLWALVGELAVAQGVFNEFEVHFGLNVPAHSPGLVLCSRALPLARLVDI